MIFYGIFDRLLKRRLVQLVLVLLGAGLIASCGGNTGDDVPLIFAAASLSDVLTDSAEVYERETGKQVVFSFGGSLALANQIAKLGAPADGAFVVGREAIRRIADADLVGSNGYRTMFSNQLAVIGPRESGELSELSDLTNTEGRIAIGNPDLAPAGEFAKQALESAGIWDAVSDRLIMTSDVRSAMAAVTSGNTKFAIVYASDVASSGDSSIKSLLVVEDGYDSIHYFSVPIKDSKNSSGFEEFNQFLASSQQTQAIFNAAGFHWNLLAAPNTRSSPESR